MERKENELTSFLKSQILSSKSKCTSGGNHKIDWTEPQSWVFMVHFQPSFHDFLSDVGSQLDPPCHCLSQRLQRPTKGLKLRIMMMDNDEWVPFFGTLAFPSKGLPNSSKKTPSGKKKNLSRLTAAWKNPSGWQPIPTFPGPSCNSHHLYLGFKETTRDETQKIHDPSAKMGCPHDSQWRICTPHPPPPGRPGKHPKWETESPYLRNAHTKRSWNHWPIKIHKAIIFWRVCQIPT